MKHLVIYFFILLPVFNVLAQDNENPLTEIEKNDSITVVDDKYREDQFYVSVTYNLLGNKPSGVSQSGFSSGFHFGFIRDMPINEKRNVAIGLGLGFSSNSYNQTLLISEENSELNYSVLNDTSFLSLIHI